MVDQIAEPAFLAQHPGDQLIDLAAFVPQALAEHFPQGKPEGVFRQIALKAQLFPDPRPVCADVRMQRHQCLTEYPPQGITLLFVDRAVAGQPGSSGIQVKGAVDGEAETFLLPGGRDHPNGGQFFRQGTKAPGSETDQKAALGKTEMECQSLRQRAVGKIRFAEFKGRGLGEGERFRLPLTGAVYFAIDVDAADHPGENRQGAGEAKEFRGDLRRFFICQRQFDERPPSSFTRRQFAQVLAEGVGILQGQWAEPGDDFGGQSTTDQNGLVTGQEHTLEAKAELPGHLALVRFVR